MKTITEREAVLRERAAFRTALFDLAGHSMQEADEAAAKRYPLPKVERARVVCDPANEKRQWRVIDGDLETRVCGSTNAFDREWRRFLPQSFTKDDEKARPVPVTFDRIARWVDLFTRPTEEVEE